MNQASLTPTFVCVDYEIEGTPLGLDPTRLLIEVFLSSGASLADHQLPVVASFEDPAAAMEASIVAQWRTQREINDPSRKVRVGVHMGRLWEAVAVLNCSNGNQIVFTGEVDTITGGTLDARPMALAQIWPGSDPVQLWLSTDSRPDIDGRPLRVPT